MNLDKMKADLIRDEGVRLKPYKDTVGKLTIGVGRNLDDVGISRDEADFLLMHDIDNAMRDMIRNIPWFAVLPEDVQCGLGNMVFNLGWPRLSKFKRMLSALEARDYHRAAEEALDSKWARQVGPRAHRIAKLFRES